MVTPPDIDRRTLLLMSSGALVSCGSDRKPAPPSSPPRGVGKAGEFDFLTGQWTIQHRRMTTPGVWDEFEGGATCWSILGGIASIEELRIPSRNFAGMGLRLLDVERSTWIDFWVNVKSGVLTTPGTEGAFANGIGTFTSNDLEGDQPVIVRGMWDRITPVSCRWSQAVSRDDGRTWEDNWLMEWVRVTT